MPDPENRPRSGRLASALVPSRERVNWFFNMVDDVMRAQSRFVVSTVQLFTGTSQDRKTRRAALESMKTNTERPEEVAPEAPAPEVVATDAPAAEESESEAPAAEETKPEAPPAEEAEPQAAVAEDATPDVSEEAVRARAYELYLQRGGLPGYETEDWLRARAELQEAARRGHP
jgi:Protein of unknown function (DUF2934)